MTEKRQNSKGVSTFEIIMMLSILFGIMLVQTVVGPHRGSGSS